MMTDSQGAAEPRPTPNRPSVPGSSLADGFAAEKTRSTLRLLLISGLVLAVAGASLVVSQVTFLVVLGLGMAVIGYTLMQVGIIGYGVMLGVRAARD